MNVDEKADNTLPNLDELTLVEKVDAVLSELATIRADIDAIKAIAQDAGSKISPFIEKLRKNPLLGGMFK